MSVTGLSIRHSGEQFQRSNETVSWYVCYIIQPMCMLTCFSYFCKMIFIFSSTPFYTKYVRMPAVTDIHEVIHNNPQFWPYFKDAISALDGSHIHTAPPSSQWVVFQNRKGFLSQNCLFACDFNLLFTYTLTRWEGSATDARIYQDACSKDLHIPEGKFFLADSGFPHRWELLVPYRNVRYHLAEWRHAQLRYVYLLLH